MTVLTGNSSSDPAGDIIVVTPSDTVDLTLPARAIRAANAGNIQVTTAAGNVRVCAFVAGETRPIRASRIWNTNTTASGIEAYV